jgi:hypothetical protein
LIDSATEFYRLQGVETMVAEPRGNPAIQMYNKFKENQHEKTDIEPADRIIGADRFGGMGGSAGLSATGRLAVCA